MQSLRSVCIAGVLSAICVGGNLAQAADQTVELNPTESSITWTGRKVTGSHTGAVALKKGEVHVDGDMVKSGRFEIDLSKVTVTDISDPKYNAKLVGHLKSADFFSAMEFPTVEFLIDKAQKLDKPLASGENYTVDGRLKIKGIEHAVQFPAKISVANGTAEAAGKVMVDRTKWNIKYGSGKFFQGLGDKLILDEFEVAFSVKGKVVA